MSILIKSMEMPISCANCPLRCYDRDDQKFCGATGNAIRYELSRPENCPLIEVPEPHGRLIDADALIKSDRMVGKLMMYGGEYVYTQAEIDRSPTIIPASEKEE